MRLLTHFPPTIHEPSVLLYEWSRSREDIFLGTPDAASHHSIKRRARHKTAEICSLWTKKVFGDRDKMLQSAARLKHFKQIFSLRNEIGIRAISNFPAYNLKMIILSPNNYIFYGLNKDEYMWKKYTNMQGR
jgi:hypothetical protein